MSSTEETQNDDQEESMRDTGVTSSPGSSWLDCYVKPWTRARKEWERAVFGDWPSYPIAARRTASKEHTDEPSQTSPYMRRDKVRSRYWPKTFTKASLEARPHFRGTDGLIRIPLTLGELAPIHCSWGWFLGPGVLQHVGYGEDEQDEEEER